MSAAPDWSAFADLDRWRPGLVAAVLRAGSVDVWASFGAAEPDGDPLTVSSPFYVASIAKQFTAAAIGLLVLDGVICLDDPVRRWLPELEPSFTAVRVHHLLEHTAGLPDANAVDATAGFGVEDRFTTADRVAVIARRPIADEPGTVHRYNNHGYVLLAEIVQRATAQCLGDFMRQQVFDPLGMADTGFLDSANPGAVPGWRGGTERVTISFRCVGDGGLATTIADLARWHNWLSSSPLADLMLRTRPTMDDGRLVHDAWGISIRSHHGLRIESHGGSIDGYLASFVRFPAVAVSIVVLANTDEYGLSGFGRRVQDFVRTQLHRDLDFSLPPWTQTHGQPVTT